MSFYFSNKSLEKLYKCHPFLVELMLDAIRTSKDDFSIICGFRSDEDQQKAYDEGNSKAKPGQSKHNRQPSAAVDIAPYPIDWDDIDAFVRLGKHVKECANFLGLNIIWGGDWTMRDYGHFELELD